MASYRSGVAYHMMVVWRSSDALVSINEVNLRRVKSTRMGDHVWVQFPVPDNGHLSLYVTSRQCQRSLAIPFRGRRNKYQPKGGDTLRMGKKGRYGSCVGGR